MLPVSPSGGVHIKLQKIAICFATRHIVMEHGCKFWDTLSASDFFETGTGMQLHWGDGLVSLCNSTECQDNLCGINLNFLWMQKAIVSHSKFNRQASSRLSGASWQTIHNSFGLNAKSLLQVTLLIWYESLLDSYLRQSTTVWLGQCNTVVYSTALFTDESQVTLPRNYRQQSLRVHRLQ